MKWRLIEWSTGMRNNWWRERQVSPEVVSESQARCTSLDAISGRRERRKMYTLKGERKGDVNVDREREREMTKVKWWKRVEGMRGGRMCEKLEVEEEKCSIWCRGWNPGLNQAKKDLIPPWHKCRKNRHHHEDQDLIEPTTLTKILVKSFKLFCLTFSDSREGELEVCEEWDQKQVLFHVHFPHDRHFCLPSPLTLISKCGDNHRVELTDEEQVKSQPFFHLILPFFLYLTPRPDWLLMVSFSLSLSL